MRERIKYLIVTERFQKKEITGVMSSRRKARKALDELKGRELDKRREKERDVRVVSDKDSFTLSSYCTDPVSYSIRAMMEDEIYLTV